LRAERVKELAADYLYLAQNADGNVDGLRLLREVQQEIQRHDFNYFVNQPPSIAQGGGGVVVPELPDLHETHQRDEPVPGPSGG